MAIDQWSTSSGSRTHRRLGRLFASSADARIIADARDGRVVFWNPGAQSLFGYSAGEVSNLTLPTLAGAEQRVRLMGFLARYEATGRLPIIDGDGRAEFLALRKTGEEVVVELTLSPPEGSPGEGRLVLASMRDVSGRLLRERELTSGRARDRRIDERDELTNLPNRAAFDRQLAQQIERSRRRRQSFALLLLDVDRFDQINHEHGTRAADTMLQTFGKSIRAELRKSDWVARYGGDEFAVLLSSTDLPSARAVAERLCGAVERTRLPHGRASVGGTVSVGIAEYLRDGLSGSGLASEADRRLHAAKEGGRNRVAAGPAGAVRVGREGRSGVTLQRPGRGRRRPWFYNLASRETAVGFALVREWGVLGTDRARAQMARYPTRLACEAAFELAVRKLTQHGYRLR